MTTNMSPEVAAAVRANQAQAEQVRSEALRRIPSAVLDAKLAAETRSTETWIAYQNAQQPPALSGDVRDRALARLEWEERQNDARLAFEQAGHELQRALAVFDAAMRNALDGMLREAEAAEKRAQRALDAKVSGAWSPLQANALAAADPTIAPLMAQERQASERVAVLAKAIGSLRS